MNAAKIARIENSLNGTARKVLEVVPKQEVWTKAQISAEIHRKGQSVEVSAIAGCLNHFRDLGLVKEPERGQFIRVTARERAENNQEEEEEIPMASPKTNLAAVAPAQAPSPEDSLAQLANLASTLRKAADEVESVALDVEARMQRIQKDTEKLRQLQAILKSIGAE